MKNSEYLRKIAGSLRTQAKILDDLADVDERAGDEWEEKELLKEFLFQKAQCDELVKLWEETIKRRRLWQ